MEAGAGERPNTTAATRRIPRLAPKATAADCTPPSVRSAEPAVRTTTKVSTARKV